MRVVTGEQMQEIDRLAIEGYGIAALVLMERAGLAVASRIMEMFPKRKVMVLVGSGNNGGDGLVAARQLHNSRYSAKALMLGNRDRMSADCETQYAIAKKMGVPVEWRTEVTPGDLHGALVVDAVFGTGLGKAVTGGMAGVFEAVNEAPSPVVAVDIASGISAATGQPLGAAIKADATVTFGAPKRGHILHPGADYTGRLFVEEIGFPPGLFDNIPCRLLEKESMALLAPRRPAYSHKGDYGHVLVLAGSRGKTGAGRMAARACLRAGAGLVTLGAPASLISAFEGAAMEEMALALPDTASGGLSPKAFEAIVRFLEERADVLALGPGIGREEETAQLVQRVLTSCPAPMVIDADGLNAIEGMTGLLREAKAPVILTPHPGEFSRLTGLSAKEIEADRITPALAFARATGVYLILKGVPTVIAEPGGEVFLNSTGNPGLAKAGSGDVLTGMVAAFLAQGLAPLEASLLGVFMHGLAGDLAAGDMTERSVLASDVIEALGPAYKCLMEALG